MTSRGPTYRLVKHIVTKRIGTPGQVPLDPRLGLSGKTVFRGQPCINWSLMCIPQAWLPIWRSRLYVLGVTPASQERNTRQGMSKHVGGVNQCVFESLIDKIQIPPSDSSSARYASRFFCESKALDSTPVPSVFRQKVQ